ncbi:MAG: hypothetical protein ABJE66_11040 [Deltaproteobacteria bacterium]
MRSSHFATASNYAVDEATGADRSTWTMADQGRVARGRTRARRCLVWRRQARRARSEWSSRAPETTTNDASITCPGCTREMPEPTEVSVNGTSVKLVHHQLHAHVTARGQIGVSATLADTSAVTGGIRREPHRCDRTIVLTGRNHYRFSCVVRVIDNSEP